MKRIMLFVKKVVTYCLLIRTGIIIQRTRCNQYTFLPSYFDSVSPHDCICFWVTRLIFSVIVIAHLFTYCEGWFYVYEIVVILKIFWSEIKIRSLNCQKTLDLCL